MTENQQPAPEEKSDNPKEESGSPSVGESSDVVGDAQNPPNADTDTRQPSSERPQIILNIYQKDRTKYHWANGIAIAALFINGTLAFFTWRLFNQTVTQTTNSTEAVKEAKRANDLSKQIFDSANAGNQRTYSLSKKANDLQIQTLKDAGNQFEIENQPILQLQDFTIKQWSKGKPITIAYAMKNMGNHPVKLTRSKTGFSIDKVIGDKDAKRNTFDSSPTSQYITKENPAGKIFTTTTQIADVFFDRMASGMLHFYFLGEIHYVNTVTGKPFKYLFTVKFDVINQTSNLVENDNILVNGK